jgi:hypothetical protein
MFETGFILAVENCYLKHKMKGNVKKVQQLERLKIFKKN